MNVAALQQENAHLKALLAQTQAALEQAEEARRRLEAIVGAFTREKFGAKSEKLSSGQYNLPLEDVEIAQGVLDAAQERAEAVITGKPVGKTRNRNRGQLPAHLPRIQRIIEPASTLCPCGCGEMTKIGEDGRILARSATDLSKPDFDVLSKVGKHGLERRLVAEAFAWRQVCGEDDVLQVLVIEGIDVEVAG